MACCCCATITIWFSPAAGEPGRRRDVVVAVAAPARTDRGAVTTGPLSCRDCGAAMLISGPYDGHCGLYPSETRRPAQDSLPFLAEFSSIVPGLLASRTRVHSSSWYLLS